MKKAVLFVTMPLLMTSLLKAEADLERLYAYYSGKQYAKACQLGLKIFNRHKKNSKFLMLYGLSCLNADYIDRLAVPMTGLRYTKTERANASYFATIILQKKLLYHALLDGVDISDLRLPKTGYILSRIFDMYVRHAYEKVGNAYHFRSETDPSRTYVLYTVQSGRAPKMIIEERVDGRLIKTHRYW
jgi:hypothetical protein